MENEIDVKNPQETNQEITKPKKKITFLKVLKKIGEIIWLVFECIIYLVGCLFAISFFLDLFDNKKK